MSIEKKPNGRWQARWRDPSGKQRAQSFARKVDAERWLASVTVDTLTGKYVDPRAGRVTVAEYAAAWAAAQPWRESTRAGRDTVIATQIVPTFGPQAIASVRPSEVQAWVGRMTTEGLAASTVRTYLRVLSQMMPAAPRPADRRVAMRRHHAASC